MLPDELSKKGAFSSLKIHEASIANAAMTGATWKQPERKMCESQIHASDSSIKKDEKHSQ